MNGKQSKGLTLIEVMLVLLLVAGGSFVLLLKFPAQTDARQLKLAATSLLGDLRYARESALAENVWYEVRFSTADDQFYRVFRGPKDGQPLTKVKEVQLPEGIRFANALPNDLLGLFFYPGGTPSKGMTIILANPRGELRKVIVAPVEGRIREE